MAARFLTILVPVEVEEDEIFRQARLMYPQELPCAYETAERRAYEYNEPISGPTRPSEWATTVSIEEWALYHEEKPWETLHE